jgi:hypothetical protein
MKLIVGDCAIKVEYVLIYHTWQELTINLIELLDQYGLRNIIITYVYKDEGLNSNAMIDYS